MMMTTKKETEIDLGLWHRIETYCLDPQAVMAIAKNSFRCHQVWENKLSWFSTFSFFWPPGGAKPHAEGSSPADWHQLEKESHGTHENICHQKKKKSWKNSSIDNKRKKNNMRIYVNKAEVRRGAWNGFSLRASRKNQPFQQFDFRLLLLAFGTVKKLISVILSQVCSNLLQQT